MPRLGRISALLIVVAAGVHCSVVTDLSGYTSASGAGMTDGGSTSEAGADAGTDARSDAAASSEYASAVLADGPIAYFRLGDVVPTSAKDETGRTEATYSGGVLVGQPGVIVGDPNTAALFDGKTGVVRLGSTSTFDFVGKAAFSVEAWVRTDAMTFGLIGKTTYSMATDYQGWFLGYSDQRDLLVRRNSQQATLAAGNVPPLGTVFHVVATFDGTTLVLYVGGVAVAQDSTVVDIPSTTAPVTIGFVDNWGTHTGLLDEVAIYDKALTPSRVYAHYAIGAGKPH